MDRWLLISRPRLCHWETLASSKIRSLPPGSGLPLPCRAPGSCPGPPPRISTSSSWSAGSRSPSPSLGPCFLLCFIPTLSPLAILERTVEGESQCPEQSEPGPGRGLCSPGWGGVWGEREDHYICFPAEQSSDPACKSDFQKHAAQARSDLFFKATVCVSVSFLSR